MKKIAFLLPLLCFCADGMHIRATVIDAKRREVRDDAGYVPLPAAVISPPSTPRSNSPAQGAAPCVVQITEEQTFEAGDTKNLKEGSAESEKGYSFIKSAIEVVLKEPVRLIQFFIKTDRLQREGHTIPICFKACTTVRFLGAAVTDGCIVTSMVNQFLEQQFLTGTGAWIWFGTLVGGMACNYTGRTIVKTMYQNTSTLYGDPIQ